MRHIPGKDFFGGDEALTRDDGDREWREAVRRNFGVGDLRMRRGELRRPGEPYR